MKVKVLFALAPLVLAPLAAQASVEVGARGVYWAPAISGDLAIDVGSVELRGDVKDDIGFSDEKMPWAEAFLGFGNHRLNLAGATVKYTGEELGVKSTLEYAMWDLAYEWKLINLENVLAGFSLGPILQVKFLDGELTEKRGGVKETESFRVPMPMIGLGVHVGILAQYLEARLRGVGMAYAGSSLLDLQGELSFNPLPFVEIVGGYRRIALDVKGDDLVGGEGELKLDFSQSGPYVGLTLKVGI